MSPWIPEKDPELVPLAVDPGLYRELLAEIAELMVESYRQLRRRKSESPSLDSPDSPTATSAKNENDQEKSQ